jgi:hypothetical protein
MPAVAPVVRIVSAMSAAGSTEALSETVQSQIQCKRHFSVAKADHRCSIKANSGTGGSTHACDRIRQLR